MRADAGLKRGRLIKSRFVAGLGVLIAASTFCCAARAGVVSARKDLQQTAELKIYLATGAEAIGQSTYTVTRRAQSESITGDSHYFNGESDIERDILARSPSAPPTMVSFDHVFFNAAGKRTIEARLDLRTGVAECTRFVGPTPQVLDEIIAPPPDTYAGAAVLIPLADELARGVNIPVEMHVFQCAPGPRIFKIHASLDRMPWPRYGTSDELIRARFVPMLGWYDALLRPFVPKTDFWLDPKLEIIGGTISRYYHGPEITMLRDPNHSGQITTNDPPSTPAPGAPNQAASATPSKPPSP